MSGSASFVTGDRHDHGEAQPSPGCGIMQYHTFAGVCDAERAAVASWQARLGQRRRLGLTANAIIRVHVVGADVTDRARDVALAGLAAGSLGAVDARAVTAAGEARGTCAWGAAAVGRHWTLWPTNLRQRHNVPYDRMLGRNDVLTQ